MCPKVIMFNTVSVDGSIRDFELDVGMHYRIADKFKADAMLIGSETAKSGIELFTEKIPTEEPADFVKPLVKADEIRPFWVLSDSKGKLKGLLHVYRRSCYCKDVIVLVTNKTPTDKVNLELIRGERMRNHMLMVYRVLTNINVLTPAHVGTESQHT